MLEPCAGKLARTVLRGLSGCKPAVLAGPLKESIKIKINMGNLIVISEE